jgi:hypothetical protein
MYVIQVSSAPWHTLLKSANRPSWNIQPVLNVNMRSCKGIQRTGEPEHKGSARTVSSLHSTSRRHKDSGA